MPGGLEGRVAIVTGASQGIGAAIAERFSAEGAHVALCARREGPLAELAGAIQAHGGSASFTALDVADHERLATFIQSTAAARGRLDVLVNNAPSAENRSAIAAPMPWLAPVTIPTRPSSLPGTVVLRPDSVAAVYSSGRRP